VKYPVSISSSSSFYSPNNTTVCTSTSIHFRRAGQQGPTRTLTAALKTFNKALNGYIFYETNKILQSNKKTRKINFFNAISKNS